MKKQIIFGFLFVILTNSYATDISNQDKLLLEQKNTHLESLVKIYETERETLKTNRLHNLKLIEDTRINCLKTTYTLIDFNECEETSIDKTNKYEENYLINIETLKNNLKTNITETELEIEHLKGNYTIFEKISNFLSKIKSKIF